MNQLLEITLRSRLVEKLCVAMYSGIFEEHADDDEQEVRRGEEEEVKGVHWHSNITLLSIFSLMGLVLQI